MGKQMGKTNSDGKNFTLKFLKKNSKNLLISQKNILYGDRKCNPKFKMGKQMGKTNSDGKNSTLKFLKKFKKFIN